MKAKHNLTQFTIMSPVSGVPFELYSRCCRHYDAATAFVSLSVFFFSVQRKWK